MPQLVPQDSDPDELLTDQLGLIHERRTVFRHPVDDRKGCPSPWWTRVFGCDGERVHEGLWVGLADIGENVVDELAYIAARGMNPRNELERTDE